MSVRHASRHPTAGHQDRERIASEPRAHINVHVGQSGRRHQLSQLRIVEAQPAIAEAVANPRFVVTAQIQHQNATARPRDPNGLGQRTFRSGGVMQRLRQQRDVYRVVNQGDAFEITLLPNNVRDAAPTGQRVRA